jgi:hypothetical protein
LYPIVKSNLGEVTMTKVTRSVTAAALIATTVAMLSSFAPRAALALEPDRASDIIALHASVPHLVPEEDPLACPYNVGAGAFRETGPDGSESTPFVVPNNMVFIATAFEWQGSGGIGEDSVWEPNVLAQAGVLQAGSPPGGNARTRIRSSAIADDDQTNEFIQVQAGNAMTMPTGVVLRADERGPLCLIIQQLNDLAAFGSAFLYGFLARDN